MAYLGGAVQIITLIRPRAFVFRVSSACFVIRFVYSVGDGKARQIKYRRNLL